MRENKKVMNNAWIPICRQGEDECNGAAVSAWSLASKWYGRLVSTKTIDLDVDWDLSISCPTAAQQWKHYCRMYSRVQTLSSIAFKKTSQPIHNVCLIIYFGPLIWHCHFRLRQLASFRAQLLYIRTSSLPSSI